MNPANPPPDLDAHALGSVGPGNPGTEPPDRPLHIAKPAWLKTKIPSGETYFGIKRDLKSRNLFTVCQEAKCPNIAECWNTNTATFMVLGGTCTRACRFCNIDTGNPGGVIDAHEAANVAESAALMKLRYVVITMVDRDDLPDGGATHVGNVVAKVREQSPGIVVELLAGDFTGKKSSLEVIAASRPEVFAHNLETVRSLTPRVRDRRATYDQSLGVLRQMKDLCDYPVLTKSALMLGLGELKEDVLQTLADLREHQVDFVTLGQYMRPTKQHLSIKRWVHPDEFEEFRIAALALGFKSVASAPLVRSSYKAREFYEAAIHNR